MSPRAVVLYEDSSAVLLAGLSGSIQRKGREMGGTARRAFPLHACLGRVHAVIARREREHATSGSIDTAWAILDDGPWRQLNASPEWHLVRTVASKWSLRGADLWHLCTAKAFQSEFPELRILTFGQQLAHAARGEGLT